MYSYDSPGYSQNTIQDQLKNMLVGQTPQQSVSRHVTKVNGRAGAEAFIMPPNSDDILLDMNEPIAWFVMTDGAGYKTITPYDLSVHKEETKDDRIKSLEKRISKLEEALRNGKSNTSATYAKPKSGEFHNDAGSRGNVKG